MSHVKNAAGQVAAITTVLLLAACGGSDSIAGPTELTFAPELGIDLSQMTQTASGLYLLDVIVGDGAEAVLGSIVTVQFSGWLTNGVLFDSGLFPFTVVDPRVIPGFNEGTLGMKIGGQRKLVMPPNIAFGSAGGGIIPPNATVVFEITLQTIE